MSTQEMIDAWERGETIEVVEMGGIAIPYEIGIYNAVFCFMRHWHGEIPPNPGLFSKWCRGLVGAKGNPDLADLTGAMFGAALNAAFMYLTHGADKAHQMAREQFGPERIIRLSRKHQEPT